MAQFDTETIFDSQMTIEDPSKKLNIIHFNDVYNVEAGKKEPVGGATRFLTVLKALYAQNPENTLVIFSGDAFSPASLSMLVKGKQVVDILNLCSIHCACAGNHDFDFGLDIFVKNVGLSNFPWILSNVLDVETGKPLGDVEDRKIVQLGDIKIGLVGLVEIDWMATLSTISFDEVTFIDPVTAGRKIASELKAEGCDLVFAITHMRWENDTLLAENAPEIDLFLGGHDHDYVIKNINEKWVIKSGTDFRELTYVEMCVENPVASVTKIDKYIINSNIEEHPEAQQVIDDLLASVASIMEVSLGEIGVDLDGRFSSIRGGETNLGNLIADIMLEGANAEISLFNSGSMRSDMIHPAGEFKVRDLKKILPYMTNCLVISVTGSILHQALENGVGHFPELEGRFPSVSGIKFAFDPSQPAGSRVDPSLIQIHGEYIDLEKEYRLMVNEYIQNGKDGYTMFPNCPILVASEMIPVLYNLVENHFNTVKKMKESGNTRFRNLLVPLYKANAIVDDIEEEQQVGPQTFLARVRADKAKIERSIIRKSKAYKDRLGQLEEEALKLAPQVEGRIVQITGPDHYAQLLQEREQRLAQ